MISDDKRQKLIVRQSCMKMAIELLNNEQIRAKSDSMIPLETIAKMTKELESFVFEVNSSDTDNSKKIMVSVNDGEIGVVGKDLLD